MPREGVLRVNVTQVHPVSRNNPKLAFLLFGGGIDLGAKNSAVFLRLDCFQNDRFVVVAENLDLQLVDLGRQVHVVIGHFDHDAFARIDPHQFLFHLLNLPGRSAGKPIAHGTNLGIVVGRGQSFGKQTVLGSTPAELIDVTGHDFVPRGDFKNVVFRHRKNVGLRWDEQLIARLDLDLVDRKGLPDVFVEDKFHVTKISRGNRKRPVGSLLRNGDFKLFLIILLFINARRLEIRRTERTGNDFLDVRVFPGARNFHSGLVVRDVCDNNQIMHARFQKDVDRPTLSCSRGVGLKDHLAIDQDSGVFRRDEKARGSRVRLSVLARPSDDSGGL